MITNPAGAHLKHMGRGAIHLAGLVVPGRYLLKNTHDDCVVIDEQHIEGEAGVAHPK